MQTNYDINKIQILNKSMIKIGNNSGIIVNESKKRGNYFYDVIFVNNGMEKFIGRYPKNETIFKVVYSNGKILVFGEKYISSANALMPTNVYELYDILDDCYYSITEEEALKLFSEELNTSFLKNKDRLTIRCDVEKKKELTLR